MRVMVVDELGVHREMLAALLSGRGLQVTGHAGTVHDLLGTGQAAPPDAVVLGVGGKPDRYGADLAAMTRIRERHPGVGLLVLSRRGGTAEAAKLLEVAARGVGFLIVDRLPDGASLVAAVRQVAAGKIVIDQDVLASLLERRRVEQRLRGLSRAEEEVLALLAEAKTNSAIASLLGCSVKTVERRIMTITRKLELSAAAGAAAAGVNIRVLAAMVYTHNARPGAVTRGY